MWRAIVVLYLLQLSQLSEEMQQQAVQQYFISRRTSADSAPVQQGYVYRQMNNRPATIETFNNANTLTGNIEANAKNFETTTKMTTEALKESKSNATLNENLPTTSESGIAFTKNLFWPERDESGKFAGKLAASGMVKRYAAIFRNDDEDIRTAFKNSYDIWPFFYQNLYEYQPKTANVDVEKAKDKRFAVSTNEKIIPVHEMVDDTPDDNSLNRVNPMQYSKQSKTATTDNPIAGNEPYFSYVLSDYFDKTDDDDPNSFKGFSWGKDFDHEMDLQDIDGYAKEMRHLEEYTPMNDREEKRKETRMLKEQDAIHDSTNIKGRESHRESESKEKGNNINQNYEGRNEYDGENYTGFKDFADSFAHRFGAEDHKRESRFAKKNNTDKGEKKKGFRTIYHKDEYQEHRDFFDNTDNSENAEEKGASKVRVGGSEALLRSLAGAATGSEQNKVSSAEHVGKKQYERNHEDKNRDSEINREIDQYRDVAKQTALSNNANYVDRYMT